MFRHKFSLIHATFAGPATSSVVLKIATDPWLPSHHRKKVQSLARLETRSRDFHFSPRELRDSDYNTKKENGVEYDLENVATLLFRAHQ
jgi:hypothetical protein